MGRAKLTKVQCPHCHGSGRVADSGGKKSSCPICHGKGYIIKGKQQEPGQQQGSGKIQGGGKIGPGQMARKKAKERLGEDAPTNSVGGSSSIHGSGAIDTFDSVISHAPLKRRLPRFSNFLVKKNGEK